MYYVLNGETIDIPSEYTAEYFDGLYSTFSTIVKLLNDNGDLIVKDIVADERLDNQSFRKALFAQDYDMQWYLYSVLDKLLSVLDIINIATGQTTDCYMCNGQNYVGDEYSFAELCYENNYSALSLKEVDIDSFWIKIKKNKNDGKKISQISNPSQYYLNRSIKDSAFLLGYFSSIKNVACVDNCSFNDWDSITETERFKVLSTFYREATYILNMELDKLGHFNGKNRNRVEKINVKLFEYRISNPNYRIYYTRRKEKLIIIHTILKKTAKIPNSTMNYLASLIDSNLAN